MRWKKEDVAKHIQSAENEFVKLGRQLSSIQHQIERCVIRLYNVDSPYDDESDSLVEWDEFAYDHSRGYATSVFEDPMVNGIMPKTQELAIEVLDDPSSGELNKLCAQYYAVLYKWDKFGNAYGLFKPRQAGDPIGSMPIIYFRD